MLDGNINCQFRKVRKMRVITLFLFFVSLSSACFGASRTPLIGAWLENDNIIVKCEEQAGQPLINAEVTIYETPSHKLAVSGRSDNAGFFAFSIPDGIREGNGLLITVAGHDGISGEWMMTAAELYAASSLTAGFDEARSTMQTPPIPAPAINNGDRQVTQMGAPTPQPVQPSVSSDEIKTIVTEILEEKLEPIRRELGNRESGGNDWWEIVGAAGWLAGLFGIFFYFMARKKS